MLCVWTPDLLTITVTHGRPHIGANGVSCPPVKMDEKLKSESMQKKSSFLNGGWGGGELIRVIMFMLYFESNQGMQV